MLTGNGRGRNRRLLESLCAAAIEMQRNVDQFALVVTVWMLDGRQTSISLVTLSLANGSWETG